MKIQYETPELEREPESQQFGERVLASIQHVLSGPKIDRYELQASLGREPVGEAEQYVVTIRGKHPTLQIQERFTRADATNDWRVSYRVGHAVAAYLRELAVA